MVSLTQRGGAQNALILEDASIELLPRGLRTHKGAKYLEQNFGVRPEAQILDSNFHRSAMSSLQNLEKRGRPDVVHFALLDATSTPLFIRGGLDVVIHSIQDNVIRVKSNTRLPRTLNRFCGVMAKLLTPKIEQAEENLFEVLGKASFQELLSSLEVERTISLTKLGGLCNLPLKMENLGRTKRTAWVVGGFAHGHFKKAVAENSNELISISEESLAAHVVTARLCYDLEKYLRV